MHPMHAASAICMEIGTAAVAAAGTYSTTFTYAIPGQLCARARAESSWPVVGITFSGQK